MVNMNYKELDHVVMDG